MSMSHNPTLLAGLAEMTPELIRQLQETGEPVVVAVDGQAELVVQDAAAYRKLLDEVGQARAVEGIRQGIEDRDAGRTISLEEFREHARRKHGISV